MGPLPVLDGCQGGGDCHSRKSPLPLTWGAHRDEILSGEIPAGKA